MDETPPFERIFRSQHPAKDKYLSRLFGLFSEQVVRCWCGCSGARYHDLGRPTLCEPDERRGHTIDFTLQDRETGRTYVAELKCELEYEGYRYLRLTDPSQLRHHTSIAFAKFLRVAANPTALSIRCQSLPLFVDGAILVWGAITPHGRQAIMKHFGLADVLSVESMIEDLCRWAPTSWVSLTEQHRTWTGELFDYLSAEVDG